MAKKYCCAECFGDPELTRNIIPTIVDGPNQSQSRTGNCGFCGNRDTTTVDPSALGDWFGTLLSSYVVDSQGKSLPTLFAEDWRLFDNPQMDEAHVKELLTEIFDDGEIVRQLYVPMKPPEEEKPQQWDELREEMMHRNRWFLDNPINLERLKWMLGQLITDEETFLGITDQWHRARLLPDDKPFSSKEMGAPPAHLAGHGRANPAGIPYLYLGSTEVTAVSEVRPHTGESACIASFRVQPISVVDLRDPRRSVSPFIFEDVGGISLLRSGLPLLERLGEELTKPVQPRSAAFEYIPSQYLCEFIKRSGYQGVIYRSSVSDGVNLALFDPGLATIDPVTKKVQVNSVTVKITD